MCYFFNQPLELIVPHLGKWSRKLWLYSLRRGKLLQLHVWQHPGQLHPWMVRQHYCAVSTVSSLQHMGHLPSFPCFHLYYSLTPLCLLALLSCPTILRWKAGFRWPLFTFSNGASVLSREMNKWRRKTAWFVMAPCGHITHRRQNKHKASHDVTGNEKVKDTSNILVQHLRRMSGWHE